MAGLGSVVAIGNDRRGLAVKSGRKACFSLVKWDNKLFSGNLYFYIFGRFCGRIASFSGDGRHPGCTSDIPDGPVRSPGRLT